MNALPGKLFSEYHVTVDGDHDARAPKNQPRQNLLIIRRIDLDMLNWQRRPVAFQLMGPFVFDRGS